MIVDREREIARHFIPREYWSITAHLASTTSPIVFTAELNTIDGRKADVTNEAQALEIVSAITNGAFRVASIKQREQRRNPAAPFTTSTLQQEASRKLKFRVRKTMQLAQALYEGVDLGGADGTQGLITYMRTDSTRIADSAKDAARDFIDRTFGPDFYGGTRVHKLREGAQDAHEAIRPTFIARPPDSLRTILKRDELRLYQLIWERFVASQMAAALYDLTTVDIAVERKAPAAGSQYSFRASGSVMKFAGFTAVYEEGQDDVAIPDAGSAKAGVKARPILPQLTQDETLATKGIEPKQHFTEPPPRFSEASLVKALEENRIGRPSTYSAIVETIQARGYVEQIDRRFHPTDIGFAVNDLLAEHFKDIVDLAFTASMEEKLDRVAEGDGDWVKVLGDFYGPFAAELALAEEKLPKFEQRDEPTDDICPNCERPMVIKTGRFGKFISCSGYPECKTTRPILKDTGALCPKDGGMVVERKSRKGRTFFGCANYPQCDFVSWDRVIPQACPVCGGYVTSKIKRGGAVTLECHTDKAHDVSALGLTTADAQDEDLEPVGV